MAKLFWLQPDNTIVEFPLTAEQNVIGRGGRSDIRIKHPGISSEHAVIRVTNAVASIEDLGSTNGTRVNGRHVKRHTLRHGDQIEVGRERLMYFAELDSASRFAQPEPDTPYSEPGAQTERVVTTPDASVAPPPVTPRQQIVSAVSFAAPRKSMAFSASVVVLSGANSGKRFPLDKPEVTLGKEGRQVIAIERSGEDLWSIRLKEGASPPYINGDAITESRPLAAGDVIELIGIKLRFEMAVAEAL
jgi:predicted component of type VI protein secretion system